MHSNFELHNNRKGLISVQFKESHNHDVFTRLTFMDGIYLLFFRLCSDHVEIHTCTWVLIIYYFIHTCTIEEHDVKMSA